MRHCHVSQHHRACHATASVRIRRADGASSEQLLVYLTWSVHSDGIIRATATIMYTIKIQTGHVTGGGDDTNV